MTLDFWLGFCSGVSVSVICAAAWRLWVGYKDQKFWERGY